MSTEKGSKLNTLLRNQPSGTVLTSSWLATQGYSLELQKRYKKSRWFDSFGTGALIRHGDTVDYLGGVYALQSQKGLSVHPGGKSALSMQGKAHYLELSVKRVHVFGGVGENLPSWFKNQDWGHKVECKMTGFLPANLGLVEFRHKSFKVNISSPARALMECLYLAPKSQSLVEAHELMECLNNLHPATVQELLEACTSIKVKRLFLYLADKAGHQWLGFLNMKRFGLGSGKRVIAPDGVYDSQYRITVPRELKAIT